MSTEQDALDAVQEADRIFLELTIREAKAKSTGKRADINRYLRAVESYQASKERADRITATFGVAPVVEIAS